MKNSITAHTRDLDTYRTTVREVFRLARQYAKDLEPYQFGSFFDAYNYSRSLPYHADPAGLETVSRPGFTLRGDWRGPRDCDDKTVQIIAAAQRFGIPVRAVVCGQIPRPHHIYPEVMLHGEWMPADATYPDRGCRIGKRLYGEVFREVFHE